MYARSTRKRGTGTGRREPEDEEILDTKKGWYAHHQWGLVYPISEPLTMGPPRPRRKRERKNKPPKGMENTDVVMIPRSRSGARVLNDKNRPHVGARTEIQARVAVTARRVKTLHPPFIPRRLVVVVKKEVRDVHVWVLLRNKRGCKKLWQFR